MVKSKKGVSYLLLFVLLGGLGYSCQNRPKEVLNRKQMERLMYDVYIAEATMESDYQNFDTPEKKEAYIGKVFKAHKTTSAQWDTSLSWYSDRIDLYLKMNDSVKVRLQRTRQGVDDMIAEENRQNPVQFSPSYVPPHFTLSMRERGFRFDLNTSDITDKISGDDFLFKFSTIGIPPRFSSLFTSLLTLVYTDTTIYRFQEIKENRTYEFKGSKYITGDTIQRITGFVHLNDSIAVFPHIQLYNISVRGVSSTVLGTDTSDTLHNRSSMPDSVMPLLRDSINLLLPDSQKLQKPDSI